jgi:hypothetical protein
MVGFNGGAHGIIASKIRKEGIEDLFIVIIPDEPRPIPQSSQNKNREG